jgi:Mrp family chromosome partitioning ATPase
MFSGWECWWELITNMPDRVLNQQTGTDGSLGSLSPEDSLPEWERVDFCLPVGTEESTISAESRVVAYHDPTSAGADRFRLAQIRLKSLQASRGLKSILVTSPMPGDGKTTVSLNLATVLSENGKVPVLLLEADVYRPTVLPRLGLKPWAGLSECCRRSEDPMLAIRRINPLGFYLLPAGQSVENDANILQSTFTSQLVKSLSASSFGWVLIDAPPTTPVADVLALNAYADATLLVARAGQTPRESIEESVRNLGREHIIGIILNGVEGLNRIYSQYYGYAKCDPPAKLARPNAIKSLGLEKRAK